VFPLGGKRRVIEQCQNDQNASAQKRIYLIDGDLDLLLKRPAPRLKHFYRLKAYNIENLLVSENAIITIAAESSVDAQWHDLATQLNLRNLLTLSIEKLIPLFASYAVAYHFHVCNNQTSSFPVQRLLSVQHDPSTLSGCLIRKKIKEVVSSITTNTSLAQYRHKRTSIMCSIRERGGDFSEYISGKTYILPLVHMQLRKVAKFNGSIETLKVRLAQHCELTIEPGFARAIIRALK
jgi:hypothetical protein